MRRLFLLVLATVIAISVVPAAAGAAANEAWLNKELLNKGAIGVQYKATAGTTIKLLIAKGAAKYTYDLAADGGTEYFPLQMGDGAYTITVLEQVSGTKFKAVHTATVALKVAAATDVYLNSVQNVSWAEAEKATAKAQELVKGKKTDLEKVEAIYKYITNNVKYDYDLAKSVTRDYIPDIDETLASGKAICYGYSSLLAAMLRSVDVPAKLVMGTTDYLSGLHAWNEVYVDGKWITLDTTVDYAYNAAKESVDWAKDGAKYKAERVY